MKRFALPVLFCYFLSLFSPQAFAREAWLDELRFSTFSDLARSERLLKKAMLEHTGSADYHFELSRVYAAYYDYKRKENLNEAETYLSLSKKELQIAIMADPEFIPAHYNLGVVLKHLKEYERSRESFRYVLELTEGEADRYVQISSLMQIGSIYQKQGFYHDAYDLFMMAKELDYYHPDIEAALEELKLQEEEGRRLSQEPLRSPHYRASDLVAYGRSALEASPGESRGSVGQILPFLSLMLFQQMMKGWNEMKKERAEDGDFL